MYTQPMEGYYGGVGSIHRHRGTGVCLELFYGFTLSALKTPCSDAYLGAGTFLSVVRLTKQRQYTALPSCARPRHPLINQDLLRHAVQ